jgi:hypothetical protein
VPTKAIIARKLNVPASTVWGAISRIGRLDVWFPSIATCRVEDEGVGARRFLTFHRGGSAEDHIVLIDHEKRRIVYDRVQSPFPVSSYIGTVEVFESFDSLAVVVWTVDFESTPEQSASVRTLLENGIGDGLLGMNADLGG